VAGDQENLTITATYMNTAKARRIAPKTHLLTVIPPRPFPLPPAAVVTGWNPTPWRPDGDSRVAAGREYLREIPTR